MTQTATGGSLRRYTGVKKMKLKTACAGCPLEFEDKNSRLCAFCGRRVQYAKEETISIPFPTEADMLKEQQKLQAQNNMTRSYLVSALDNRVCEDCGGDVSRYSQSKLCFTCYHKSGGTCKMADCENKLSPRNNSGYCRGCTRIVNNRIRRGSDPHAPVKRRKKKIE